jgi:S1-C subfamily serine protease
MFHKSLIGIVAFFVVIGLSGIPVNAYDTSTLVRPGFLTLGGIPDKPQVCGVPARSRGVLEYQVDNTGVWQPADYPSALAGKSKCVTFHIQPNLLPDLGKPVSFRVRVPAQSVRESNASKRKVDVKEKLGRTYGPYLDVRQPKNLTTPIASTQLFSETFGKSVATVFCRNPNNGKGGQGSAFAVTVALGPDASQHGSTYLATAAHVVKECNYSSHDTVTISYQGVDYPGRVWWGGYNHPADVASIVTTAPIPSVTQAIGTPPTAGDIAIAIGTATGVAGTVTQGQVVGVSRQLLNLTTPSGPGGSGGPVFNNRGEVIGLIIAGSGSLTVAQALPSMCDTVYAATWIGCTAWPGR